MRYLLLSSLLLLLSRFSRVRLCATPETAAHQAPPSLGFSRQEHWSGLPFPSPMHESEKWKWSHSVVSDSLRPHGLQPTRLLCPWDFLGKSAGVGCHCLLWSSLVYSKEKLRCRDVMNQLEIRELVNDEAMVGMNKTPVSLSRHIPSACFFFAHECLVCCCIWVEVPWGWGQQVFSCVPYADTYANGTLSLCLYNEKWCKLNSEKKEKKKT